MNETSPKKSGWRWLRRLLIGAMVLVTLIGLLVTEENWRGKRAWENYRREWTAKGEKFDWQSFAPPAVPDEQNFFTAPIFTNMQNHKLAMTPYGKDGGPDSPFDLSRSGYAIYRTQAADLIAWQNYYRNPTNLHLVVGFVATNGTFIEQPNYLDHATDKFPVTPQPQTPAKDVLFALSKYDSAVEELHAASQRPYANVPLNYEDGFDAANTLLPVLAELKRCTQLLQLRSVAELADGQSTKALDDVKLLLYLNNSLHSSPFLISHLVRMAIVAIGIQPIWEGLAEHKWSDEQLVELDSELAKMDFLGDYGFFMRGERALSIQSLENQRRTRQLVSSTENGVVTNSLKLMPSAYFYQNELAFARMHQEWVLPLVDTNKRVVSLELLHRANTFTDTAMKHYSPYEVQALMLMSALSASTRKVAQVQCQIDLARVACALERYRLAYGNYPDTLDTLAPKFIAQVPHDVINGEPLHYRRETNGQFVLYSVGLNETDDGGTIVVNKAGTVDREKGDWVWQYPPK